MNLIDAFLASLISIISINPDYKLSSRAVSILFTYLKNGICVNSKHFF